MSLDQSLQLVPAFVLAFFRVAGMMLTAPFLGSARIPQRIKLMMALVIAAGMLPAITAPAELPATPWQLALGIAGEMLFGLAIGTALSFTLMAALWAGDLIGQQMGLGLGQTYDPQFGQSGSVVSDLYFYLALVIFLVADGHHAFLRGVNDSFAALPLLSVGMTTDLLGLVIDLLHAATLLALQLAAPMIVTMLVTDVVLGFLSKTVPQINVMTTGTTLKSMVGIGVLALGMTLSSDVVEQSMLDAMERIGRALVEPLAA